MLSPIVPFLAIWLMTTICCEGIAVKSQEKAQLFAEAEALVTHVNQRQSSWRAATNPRFAAMTFEEKKYLMGVKRPIPSGDKKKKMMGNILEEVVNSESIPEEFDARKHFPECAEVIATIQDQSACGSCWAVSVASVITDRICVASEGKLKLNISALDLLSCEPRSDGCYGGWEDAAFDFYVRSGLCTGSNYEHHQGCKPYPWASVPHPSQQSMHETPKCTQFCENSNYTMRYARDKHYGTDPVSLTDLDSSDLAKIQLEIMRSGPVTISFMVYEDFTHYASGVYQHLTGEALGGHAVRLIGWGTDPESKVPYWLIANSWSNDWGENGYFRIRRGSDECFIESWGINWAKPDLD